MSRYHTCKHGIRIGWGNLFSYRDGDELVCFNAILVIEPLYPANINTLTVGVRSFASQLCVYEKPVCFPVIGGPLSGGSCRRYFLRGFWVSWLKNHVAPGGYGIPPLSADFDNRAFTIFFERLTDARAFRNAVHEHLDGFPSVSSMMLHNPKRKRRHARDTDGQP
ncbi:hypothetical protein RCDURKIN_96 [Rhodobacter phage RcDurkin]|nr:hypothetical protein RCDURKIN_96 [Rhodobacter phage RcDurkin]